MAELNVNQNRRVRRIRHRGRSSQVLIYLGKQLRFFINQRDWIMLPLAAVIAALVSMVIHEDFFHNMEGNLMGAFALTCVAIWNGCFNSIQAICRERPIIKREHRSGMHVTSYIAAHMIYQFGLCAAQTGISMYVMLFMGVEFPIPGFMTDWMLIDVAISMLLISYASDMLSLFISSLSHTTTGAMTVMPFVLIFQLVFSGGLLPLPEWTKPIANYTISNYGLKVLAAQSGYNEVPMVTGWKTLNSMRSNEVGGTVTVGQILDLLDSPAVEKRRDMEVLKSFTVGEAADILSSADEALELRQKEVAHPVTIRSLLEALHTEELFKSVRDFEILPENSWAQTASLTVDDLITNLLGNADMNDVLNHEIGATLTVGDVLEFLHAEEITGALKDKQLNDPVTLGDIADFLKNNQAIQAQRDRTITLKATMSDLFDLFGEQNVKTMVQEKTAEAARKPDYERTESNIIDNWVTLGIFIIVFAVLSVISLELIDRDKR
ncbi:MAG: ABC transporter permease [Clostridia bacterium]|nr:ABC transporter permease [Clostridia bacterium]